jgi:hypothetical protein
MTVPPRTLISLPACCGRSRRERAAAGPGSPGARMVRKARVDKKEKAVKTEVTLMKVGQVSPKKRARFQGGNEIKVNGRPRGAARSANTLNV